MVNLIRITEPTDIRLQKLIPLYKEAFPEEERRNIKQLERPVPCFTFSTAKRIASLINFSSYITSQLKFHISRPLSLPPLTSILFTSSL